MKLTQDQLNDRLEMFIDRANKYALAAELEDQNQAALLKHEGHKIGSKLYTYDFIEYLKQFEIDHVLWTDGNTEIVVGTHHNSKHERILKRRDCNRKKRVKKTSVLPNGLDIKDIDTMTIYCELMVERFELIKRLSELKKETAQFSSELLLKHLKPNQYLVFNQYKMSRGYVGTNPFVKVELK